MASSTVAAPVASTSSEATSSASSSVGEKALVECFHGVYLLVSLNPRMKGRTYIGFTVDPERRLRQHNRGKEFGGAWRTSGAHRGPWAMVLIVHGFPNSISALRFEWAWQHPRRSRRLAAVPPKRAAERLFDYNFRLLGEMLRCGPWRRLPLTVRWIRPDVRFAEFPPERRPPPHMDIVTGPVASVKPKKKKKKKDGDEMEASQKDSRDENLICSICIGSVTPAQRIQCLSDRCQAVSHLLCLAQHFRAQEGQVERILPLAGSCPVCEARALWGDLVRAKKVSGTYKPRGEEEEEAEEEAMEEQEYEEEDEFDRMVKGTQEVDDD